MEKLSIFLLLLGTLILLSEADASERKLASLPCPISQSLEQLNETTFDVIKTELSQEFFPKESPKGVFIVVHGLNLKPSKMNAFVDFLTNNGYYVLRTTLHGHRGNLQEQKEVEWKDWMEGMHKHYCYAKSQAEKLKVPLYNLSFSLGALVSMGHIQELDENPYRKQIFLAPATWIHWYGKIPGWLGFLGGEVGIPSKNLEEYRSQPTTSLNCYRSMKEGRKKLEELKGHLLSIPSLVVMDPKDELVSLKKIKNFLNEKELNDYWETLEVSNKETELKKSYHHLIVDEKTLGKKQWKSLLERLSSFLVAEEIAP